ncbi:unnamed protein product [Notodromas monacha]|uniref:Amyloid beta A4 protein-binding family B member 2 n=1 Tax=Notodromas monacha TaxID=399045 RepID=A0A7R9GH68_9CRUS|nr:unnamed protein product [Notodromas monacha]CAG0922461.1 unnamed protein product [Notodromas monacha]
MKQTNLKNVFSPDIARPSVAQAGPSVPLLKGTTAMDPLKTILALFLILSGSFESAAAGLACYTCSDGCDHPREPGMGVMTEHCDLEKDQAPICASFFDPENRHYNYGRGCVRMSDRPQEFQESECVIMDVADFWNPNGPKRKTCEHLCDGYVCDDEFVSSELNRKHPMDWEDSNGFESLKEGDLLGLSSGTRLSFENPNYFLSQVTARLNDTLNSNGAGPTSETVKPRRRRSMSAEDSSSEDDEPNADDALLMRNSNSSLEEEIDATSSLTANHAKRNPRVEGPNRTRRSEKDLKPMETESDDFPEVEPVSSALWEASKLSSTSGKDLPYGWEERRNPRMGLYYYHTGTGISQKERPRPVQMRSRAPFAPHRPLSMNMERISEEKFRRSLTSSATLSDLAGTCSSDKWKRNSLPASAMEKLSPCRFVVRNLGSLEIPEEELTPDKSSKAVNRCIIGLSGGSETSEQIANGDELYLDLDDSCLKLVHVSKGDVLVSQPIHTIRVWGVGRDNGRSQQKMWLVNIRGDFAYVAKNKPSRKYMCHVFRCDGPARVIANSLRDICKRIMMQRNTAGGSSCSINSSSQASSSEPEVHVPVVCRPTSLPVDRMPSSRNAAQIASLLQTFPTPMDEPRKIIQAVYVGSQEVNKSSGMDVLHGAIDYLTSSIPMDQWAPVNIAVAPSTITVSSQEGDGRNRVDFECRVRFLSFLGIGKNIIYCGIIVHTAQEKFIAHVFSCEPSSAGLCRTVEAACKLRYQKCMDAHGPRKTKPSSGPTSSKSSAESTESSKTFKSTLKSMFGSLANVTTKRMKSLEC